MFCYVNTGAVTGLKCDLIRVEVDSSPGLPCFQMVGYLGSEVKEARERVKVALRNSGFVLPATNLNVNLSPANIRKSGTSYDLPIAVGILAASGMIDPHRLEDMLIIGELGLDGDIRRVRGILPIVKEAVSHGIRKVILPISNVREGALIPDAEVIGASHLSEVREYLSVPADEQDRILKCADHTDITGYLQRSLEEAPDFADVRGQESVKRAAMVAAAGFHHMLMIGPPGSGKTMIARRMPSILPSLTPEEALEISAIYSVSGQLKEDQPLVSFRPYIAPHHTITQQALAGGGVRARPGLISLAHRGVLFLDEMTEFDRSTLEIMRQPLEDKQIRIVRSSGSFSYPADFMLIAACNPCPCGYYPDMNKCRCSPTQITRYINRISGPLLDRIDICCEAEVVELCKLQDNGTPSFSSADMRAMIEVARKRQAHRFRDMKIHFNAEMSGRDTDRFCRLGASEQLLISSAVETLGLSARSYHRILKLSRTIADLEDKEDISETHLSEALFYRTSGTGYWGR
ncbi:MAG: YifB family Mg chelatase-like AAA ATPase [Lachnospiraceae bacterium]|nr:YifB family Mg chelatase-like AAA ATPase [Lachnospiraceae bacterium]